MQKGGCYVQLHFGRRGIPPALPDLGPCAHPLRPCEEEFGWKKSTTYTQVRRLADKGLLQNEQAVVTPLVTRDQVQREESDRFVSRTFGGSLPGFVAAFLKGRTLSESEVEELKTLIDQHRG